MLKADDPADDIDEADVGNGDTHGSVTFMPNILPGGSASIAAPVSLYAKRRAMASSTACWRLRAT